MTRLTTRAAAGLMAGAMLFGASGAMADSSAALTSLKAVSSGDTLTVSGRSAFTAEPTVIATDADDDGSPGAELVGASIGFDGARDIEFTVLDRKGYKANWLERKMTAADKNRIEQEILDYTH